MYISAVDRQRAIELLSDVAREQAGYVTTAQAKRLGVPGDSMARMARRGDLRRIRHSVYALPGSFPGPREDVAAAWLRLSGDRLPWDRASFPAVASHTTAAAIHRFGTFSPASPTFTVAKRRFQPPDESLRLFTAHLEPVDWGWVVLPEGMRLPVTTPARTIADLAFAGEEHGHVLDALAEAREAGLLTDADVVAAVSRRRRRRGRGSVGWLAAALSPR
jgi:predicted transcriptional regulator of viral defense system